VHDELIPVLPADEPVQVEEEVEPLFVGDRAERVVGVLVLEVDDELGELVVRPVLLDGILCKSSVFVPMGFERTDWLTKRLPADNGGKVKVCLAVHTRLDSPLQVHGPALVEPAAQLLAGVHPTSDGMKSRLTSAPSLRWLPSCRSSCARAHGQSRRHSAGRR